MDEFIGKLALTVFFWLTLLLLLVLGNVVGVIAGVDLSKASLALYVLTSLYFTFDVWFDGPATANRSVKTADYSSNSYDENVRKSSIITVRVVDEDDEERTFEGKTVSLHGSAASFRGTTSAFESTNEDGEAIFDMEEQDFRTSEPITIQVSGYDTEWGPYDISDESNYTFTVTI